MKVLCIRRHNERIRWCDDEKRRERERDALSSLSYTSFDQLKKNVCVFMWVGVDEILSLSVVSSVFCCSFSTHHQTRASRKSVWGQSEKNEFFLFFFHSLLFFFLFIFSSLFF